MKISIITVTLNNVKGLIRTVQAVINQSYNEIEFIIIDGGSTDGSKEYLVTMESHFSYWHSHTDNGIYDAMNKGVDQATGDYLLFLNSGDWLYNDHVIAYFCASAPVEDIVYGNTIYKHPQKADELKIMPDQLNGMTIFYRTLNHQSTFYKRSVFQGGRRYDERYRFLADWVLYNTVILLEKGTFRHLDLIVANYDLSGQSSDPENKEAMDKERMAFYATHVETLIAEVLRSYESVQEKYRKLKSLKEVNYVLKIRKGLSRLLKSWSKRKSN